LLNTVSPAVALLLQRRHCPHVPRRNVAAADDTWLAANKNVMRVSGSDSYALLFLFIKTRFSVLFLFFPITFITSAEGDVFTSVCLSVCL